MRRFWRSGIRRSAALVAGQSFERSDHVPSSWTKAGVHHPFLLPGYKGDRKYYHKTFAEIGFRPED